MTRSSSAPPSATCWRHRRKSTSATSAPTVSLERRLRALRDALAGRSSIDFDEQFGGEDRLTQAVTLFALLELYRKGEVTWEQSKPFGPIEIRKAVAVHE